MTPLALESYHNLATQYLTTLSHSYCNHTPKDHLDAIESHKKRFRSAKVSSMLRLEKAQQASLIIFSGNPDILICGNCKELFEDLVDMIDHKKNHCNMRFTCKCDFEDHDDDSIVKKKIAGTLLLL